MTMFVLEDVVTRRYANGEQSYGTSWMVSSDTNYKTLKQVIVHEKHLKMLKKMTAFLVVRYTLLEDGTVKLGQQTVVMQSGRPAAITDDVIMTFVQPPVVEELGRISSFENKKRISVKGEVTKVSSIIEGSKSKRKIITLSDGQASIDIKLWGGLSETVIHEGTTIEVSCVHVDVYQNKRSLNSTGGTQIKITDAEEDFQGYIEGVSFDESCLAIFINDEVLTCTANHVDSLFPTHEFVDRKHVKGKKKGSIVMSIEEHILAEEEDELLAGGNQADEEQLDESVLAEKQ
ncbi:uncharacterized protein LOC134272683 isoform X2 [Saccostrea cucullata]